MTDPKTLTEAVNLGKGYGIDTAETILALAISKAIEERPQHVMSAVIHIRENFKALCAEYKSQLTKPVTEEEKRKLLSCKVTGYREAIDEMVTFIEDHNMQPPLMDKLISMKQNIMVDSKVHICRYSRAMNEPRPRLCVECGKPEELTEEEKKQILEP